MKFDRLSPNWPISNSLSLSREKLRFHFPRRDSVSFEIGFRNLKEKLFLIPSSRSIIIGWRILLLRRLLRAGPLLHENNESGSDSNYSSCQSKDAPPPRRGGFGRNARRQKSFRDRPCRIRKWKSRRPTKGLFTWLNARIAEEQGGLSKVMFPRKSSKGIIGVITATRTMIL